MSNEFGLFDGDENCIVYHLYYHGGSRDGESVNSLRPYEEIRFVDTDEIYKSKEPSPDCLVWEKDYTFGIDLYLVTKNDILSTI